MRITKSLQIDLSPPLELDGYVLSNCGYCCAVNAPFVPDHWHWRIYELTAFVEGKGKSYVGKTPTDVQAGDIFVSFPFEKHRVTSDPENLLKYAFLSFYVTTPKFDKRLKRLWEDNPPPPNRVFRNDTVFELIGSVISEFDGKRGKYSSELFAAALEQITVYLLRDFSDRIPQPMSQTPTDEELCLRLTHYIDTHLLTMKQLTECADQLSYNYCYLSTLFKRTTGTTLANYYRKKRLEMAKFFIEENMYSFGEIAEQLNYSGISAFSKAFRAQFGISPRVYEKECLAKKKSSEQ